MDFHDKADIKGDLVGGDKLTYIDQVIVKLVADSPPLALENEHQSQLHRDYRQYIRETCEYLDFKGINLLEAVEKASGLPLGSVYVPVRARPEAPEGETWQRIGGRFWEGGEALSEDELHKLHPVDPVPVEQALSEHPALVVLGDPGSGKSTLFKHIALSLSRREAGPLPILLPLNAYSKALQQKGALSLDAFLPRYFEQRLQRLTGLDHLFQSAFQQGKAWVLLDGLDEVTTNREYLVGLVEEFVRAQVPQPQDDDQHTGQLGNRVVITSRFVGYRQAALTDSRWRVYAMVDWETDEITRFVSRFTKAVERAVTGGELAAQAQQSAAREGRELLAAISGHPGIERLAGNPLLLTILALIKRQGVTLPQRRTVAERRA